jgi:hypothetical protein
MAKDTGGSERGDRRRSSDLAGNSLPKPSWPSTAAIPWIEPLFLYLEAHALVAIDWYLEDKRSKARWSRSLRVLTILLTAGGGLVPLLRASGVETLRAEWGYVLLALAAACIGLDRFFGFHRRGCVT